MAKVPQAQIDSIAANLMKHGLQSSSFTVEGAVDKVKNSENSSLLIMIIRRNPVLIVRSMIEIQRMLNETS